MINYGKFGRNFSLIVQAFSLNDSLQFALPLTVEFDITRKTYQTLNVASIRIYNLNRQHRNLIHHNINAYGVLQKVFLNAGYGNILSNVFTGDVTQCYSVREGVNFITTIECFTGSFVQSNGRSVITFTANTPKEDVIKAIVGNMSTGPNKTDTGITLGAIGNSYGGTVGKRGGALVGNPIEQAREFSGGQFFIDNDKAYFLADKEVIAGSIPTIDSSNGLLGTPQRENTLIHFDIVFEPRVVVGQKINLVSATVEGFNGLWKVIGIKHRGTISSAVCGDAITTLDLQRGDGQLESIAAA